ncbi:MAG: hypothetical protein U0841_19365 [Chloroflexia bacterium]
MLTATVGNWLPIVTLARREIDTGCVCQWRTGWVVCDGGTAMWQQGKRLYATSDGGAHWDNGDRSPTAVPEIRMRSPLSSIVSDICFFDARRGWLPRRAAC